MVWWLGYGGLDYFDYLMDAEYARAPFDCDKLHRTLGSAGGGREHAIEPPDDMFLLPVHPAAWHGAQGDYLAPLQDFGALIKRQAALEGFARRTLRPGLALATVALA